MPHNLVPHALLDKVYRAVLQFVRTAILDVSTVQAMSTHVQSVIQSVERRVLMLLEELVVIVATIVCFVTPMGLESATDANPLLVLLLISNVPRARSIVNPVQQSQCVIFVPPVTFL
jgi:hypothetical protein